MICSEHKFTVLHFPKTGGNSLHRFLRPLASHGIDVGSWNQNKGGVAFHYDGHRRGKHHSLEQRHAWLESHGEPAGEFLYFSNTRNPWDMVFSRYLYYHNQIPGQFEHWNGWLSKEVPVLAEKLRRFYRNPHGVEVVYLRLENIVDDVRSKLVDRLGLPLEGQIEHHNKSRYPRGHYREYYADPQRDWVGENFRDYIEAHGYAF